MLAASAADPDPLVLNRFLMRLRIDPDKQRIDVEQGELGNMDVGVAISGSLDYGGDEPRLAHRHRRHPHVGRGDEAAVAGHDRPEGARPGSRITSSSGTVERVLIATNAPMATLKPISPPMPDDGLSIEITGSGAEIRPVEGLPRSATPT